MMYISTLALIVVVFLLLKITNILDAQSKFKNDSQQNASLVSNEENGDLDEYIEGEITKMFSDYPSGLSVGAEMRIQDGRRAYYRKFKNEDFSMLFPLFSAKKLAWEELLYRESELKFQDFWDQLPRAESEEIKKFVADGGDRSNFKLSSNILEIIYNIIREEKISDYRQKLYRKMIEANIKVLHGDEIGKQEELYYKTTKDIPTVSLISDEGVEKEAIEFLEIRQKHCLESWESKLSV